MFGSKAKYGDYTVLWNRYSALTVLFVIQIAICIFACIEFVVEFKIKKDDLDDDTTIYYFIPLALLSFAASIISFCTTDITNITISSDVKLGFGPIFYGILQLLVLFILSIKIFCFLKDKGISQSYKAQQKRNVYFASNTQTAKTAQETSESSTKISEQQKIEYLSKYKKMFDEGVITEEEFNKKKSELL